MPDPDPNNCRSCLHLGNMLRGMEFLGGLVPLPGHAKDTYVYMSTLLGGHLQTSHAAWLEGDTASHPAVAEDHPIGPSSTT